MADQPFAALARAIKVHCVRRGWSSVNRVLQLLKQSYTLAELPAPCICRSQKKHGGRRLEVTN
jgi:hypothetical protein